MNTYIKNMALVVALFIALTAYSMDGGASAGAGAGEMASGSSAGADEIVRVQEFIRNQPGMNEAGIKNIKDFDLLFQRMVFDLCQLNEKTAGFRAVEMDKVETLGLFTCKDPRKGLGILQLIVDAMVAVIPRVGPGADYKINHPGQSEKVLLLDFVAWLYKREFSAPSRERLMGKIFKGLISLGGEMSVAAKEKLEECIKRNAETRGFWMAKGYA